MSFFLLQNAQKYLKKVSAFKLYFNCFCTTLDLIDIYYMDIFINHLLCSTEEKAMQI